MSRVETDSMFFVGGRGTGADGDSRYVGGCLRSWWLTECPNDTDAEKAVALAKLMGVNGAPINSAIDCSIMDDGGKVKIYKSGSFTNSAVGMIVYCDFSAYYTDGQYEIVARTDSSITIDQTFYTSAATCNAYVGGAYDCLQSAFTEVRDSNKFGEWKWIYDNLDEAAAGAMDATLTGDIDENGHIFIIGYKDVPGDLDYGGTHYGDYVTKTGGAALADHIITLQDSAENLHFWNFEIKTNSGAYGAFLFPNTYGVELANCYFNDLGYGIYSTAVGWAMVIRDCVFDNMRDQISITAAGGAWYISNCKFTKTDDDCRIQAGGDFFVTGCIFNGTGLAVNNYGGAVIFRNNTCYNISVKAIKLKLNSVSSVVENNIFYLSAIDAYAVYRDNSGTGATSTRIANNCVYCPVGAINNPFYDAYGDDDIPAEGTLEEDPRLDLDYVPGNSKLLESGIPDISGMRTHIGAIGKSVRSRSIVPALAGSPITGAF
jgi:hypothetical protein